MLDTWAMQSVDIKLILPRYVATTPITNASSYGEKDIEMTVQSIGVLV